MLPRTKAARQAAFKHFLPRCLELIGDIGNHGILRERTIFAPGFLTTAERKAVDAWLMHYWRVSIESDATLPVNVTIVARCVPNLKPYLAAWERSTNASAQRLRAQCAEDVTAGRDSLLSYDCLNSHGDAEKRAHDLARWLAPDWTRRIFG